MSRHKKYTINATAKVEIEILTDSPEQAKSIAKRILNNVCKSAEVENVSIREATELPKAFTNKLYDKFTGGKG